MYQKNQTDRTVGETSFQHLITGPGCSPQKHPHKQLPQSQARLAFLHCPTSGRTWNVVVRVILAIVCPCAKRACECQADKVDLYMSILADSPQDKHNSLHVLSLLLNLAFRRVKTCHSCELGGVNYVSYRTLQIAWISR